MAAITNWSAHLKCGVKFAIRCAVIVFALACVIVCVVAFAAYAWHKPVEFVVSCLLAVAMCVAVVLGFRLLEWAFNGDCEL